ncbi:hypothetical protein JYK21_29620 [Ralstonia pickettii]|nr:hypothetical protein [Ralstonia pickettii]
MNPNKKTPDQIKLEQEQIAKLRAQLLDLTSHCPKSVLAGSHQKAVSWKAAAVSARRLAESKSPTLTKLQNAVTSLLYYEEAAA